MCWLTVSQVDGRLTVPAEAGKQASNNALSTSSEPVDCADCLAKVGSTTWKKLCLSTVWKLQQSTKSEDERRALSSQGLTSGPSSHLATQLQLPRPSFLSSSVGDQEWRGYTLR